MRHPSTVRVLIGCEHSGEVRRAFRALGFDAWSCDLLPSTDNSPHHIVGDILDALDKCTWDLVIAHPPCTYLTNASVWCLHQPTRFPRRWQQLRDAAKLFATIWQHPHALRLVVENPVMHGYAKAVIADALGASTWLEPTQSIQPYQFGHPESKRTCLWIRGGLFNLQPTCVISKPACGHWNNQTPSGQNKLGPSKDRWARRSHTYSGIAAAMAEQWGRSILNETDHNL